MSDENANPQGSENPAPFNPESAFDDYLKRQAPSAENNEEQPLTEAENGQSETDAKPDVAETQETEEQHFTVKVNGEEKSVPLSELLKGYSMESDYRVKSSKVAEQARAAQEQHEHATQERQRFAQGLQAYQDQLASIQPQPPDPGLIDTDPVNYLRQQQAFNGWQQQMQRAQWESQQLNQRAQDEQAQWRSQHLETEYQSLLVAIPEWKDSVKANSGKSELSAYLRTLGYEDGQIAQAVDHREIVVARKAMLYDRMMAKQADVTNKVANLPQKAPQRPGSGQSSAPDGRTRAMQSLKKSGSLEDATQAFAALYG